MLAHTNIPGLADTGSPQRFAHSETVGCLEQLLGQPVSLSAQKKQTGPGKVTDITGLGIRHQLQQENSATYRGSSHPGTACRGHLLAPDRNTTVQA